MFNRLGNKILENLGILSYLPKNQFISAYSSFVGFGTVTGAVLMPVSATVQEFNNPFRPGDSAIEHLVFSGVFFVPYAFFGALIGGGTAIGFPVLLPAMILSQTQTN